MTDIIFYIKYIKSEIKKKELRRMIDDVNYSENPFIEYIWRELVEQIEDEDFKELEDSKIWEQAKNTVIKEKR